MFYTWTRLRRTLVLYIADRGVVIQLRSCEQDSGAERDRRSPRWFPEMKCKESEHLRGSLVDFEQGKLVIRGVRLAPNFLVFNL